MHTILTSQDATMNYNFLQVLTQVVLIPFMTKAVFGLTPAERRLADKNMASAMEKASRGAPLIVSLGAVLTSSQSLQELDAILEHLTTLLPPETKQRVHVSYGWLILATLKVRCGYTET